MTDMHISTMAKQAERFITDNSPAILTALGIAGTVGTAYLTGKAVLKADRIIREANEEPHLRKLTNKEAFELTWSVFVPPVALCAVTVTSIFFANRIGARRAAAIAAAYTLSDKAFAEYKDKVAETIGKNKEQKVRDDVAQASADNNPPSDKNVVIMDPNGQLFRDQLSGRYFETTVEEIKAAENMVNRTINNDGYADLNEFYTAIGLESNDMGAQLGWSQSLIDVDLSSAGVVKGKPFVQLGFYTPPKPNFDRF